MTTRRRAVRSILGLAAAVLFTSACHPTPPPRPEPPPRATPRPQPSRSPRPRPSRTPSDRDTTRDPLTRLINKGTPETTAEALRLAEKARLELDKGTTDKAIELLEQAIQAAPRCVPPYVILARAEIAEGQLDRARTHLGRAAGLSPEPVWRAEIIALNGVINESSDKTDAAVASYNLALQVFPGNRTAREGLARLKK
ncbi:MAG TPA: tetratricopeptide repeat protein [Candidatus Bathyarchaeia archaeon]|nr:tetratricopeptide repeat protein [Candidatus Bathyarchaeia archaeon]